MSHYQHLCKTERMEISILLRKGYAVADIAHELYRHKSSIYSKIRRNTVAGHYVSGKAQHKAYVRRKYSKYQAMHIIEDMKLREYIDTRLLIDDWTPRKIFTGK